MTWNTNAYLSVTKFFLFINVGEEIKEEGKMARDCFMWRKTLRAAIVSSLTFLL